MAKLAGLSTTGFNRTFKRHLGTSPERYVTQVRVRETARLLL
jgi:transcriptional regulator GlxA family with amidase domain